MRIFFGAALVAVGCGTSTPRPELTPLDDRAMDAEALLVEIAGEMADGDLEEARELLVEVETIVRVELAHHPDRHQLQFRVAEVRARLNGEAPPEIEVAAAPEPAPAPAPIVAPEPEPEPEAKAPEAEETLLAAAAPAPSIADAARAFEAGPLRDRTRGLRIMKKGKRTRNKKKKRRLFAEARTALESCADSGSRMVGETPALSGKRFKVGRKRMKAQRIVGQCKNKLRWIDKRLKRRGSV